MRHLIPLACLLLAGCGPSLQAGDEAPAVRLTAEPARLAPGDTLTLVLTNDSTTSAGYNLCTSTLERRTGDAWREVPTDRVCTMELRILEPGQEERYPMPIAPDRTPGEYRYGTGVELDGRRTMLWTGVFRLEG